MPCRVVVGAQWGDEGKGKVIDLCTDSSDVVVRWGGGNNAGHTLEVDGTRLVLHLLPSGVLHPGKVFLLGDGMVIDPAALLAEMDALARMGICLEPSVVRVSLRAHLVLPYHRAIDELNETSKSALGTTRRGIGPAYEDKAARRGVRAGDLLRPDRLRERLERSLEEANARVVRMQGTPLPLAPLYEELLRQGEALRPYLADTSSRIYEALAAGRRVLLEGAQGALLDIDHGTYPYVTSSVTVASGAMAGVRPGDVEAVIGVSKAYATRVGAGPFPSEMAPPQTGAIREAGREYGATTGRPRRCGWLDLPALRYAARVSGLTGLALTKLDVLSGVRPLLVCEAYEVDGQRLESFPADAEDLALVRPVLREVAPFEGDISGVGGYADLPRAARSYVEMVEREVGVPVQVLSLGPARRQTLLLGEFEHVREQGCFCQE
jgi:adenylosuccinate synthase